MGISWPWTSSGLLQSAARRRTELTFNALHRPVSSIPSTPQPPPQKSNVITWCAKRAKTERRAWGVHVNKRKTPHWRHKKSSEYQKKPNTHTHHSCCVSNKMCNAARPVVTIVRFYYYLLINDSHPHPSSLFNQSTPIPPHRRCLCRSTDDGITRTDFFFSSTLSR